jgi:KDO2-lipid IV(A) lauroyltransferase
MPHCPTPSEPSLPASAATRVEGVPRRWTLHGLNNGLIFGATYRGVTTLPRALSYAIARAGSWIAWHTMMRSRRALAENLGAIFPDEDRAARERRARVTLHSYCLDVIDFLRALEAPPADAVKAFDVTPEYRELFEELQRRGRGIILVTAHYGNWEVGSVLVRRLLNLPLTIVAMREASPTVNRIRRNIRERLGADTIEVRQSLDTPLQIRRRLSENQVVAMLIDRHYGRDRVPVTVCGRSAWFLRTPLLMAYLTGAPVVPCFIERTGPGRFEAHPGTPIYLDAGSPRDEAIRSAAQHIADQVSERVRAHPEFWYQFYRYWEAQRDTYDGLA